ncbi:MAG: glutamyl-tRNA(Gln) amidotransferase subunit D [Euryarchaeota archaeon RBG_16_68_13]|nr:MAG: glutamyl-tRNA(Gln) amidotransferase subunit D [Euryarchaeota archaeon RBG_16_68_13]
MEYPKRVRDLLERAGAIEGDSLEVSARGKTYEGVLMPHHSFSGEDILTVKLVTGYNIGIAVQDVERVAVLRKAATVPGGRKLPPPSKDLPTVAVLGTGGTIASYVDYRTGAVHPAVTAEELIFSVPELLDVCNVRARVIFSLYSEDLKPDNWTRLAKEAAAELNGGARGVIIPHGTDTLHFTSAALSFMLRDLTGPVAIVGAQRSSDRPSSDAASNLLAAARVAVADLGEVVGVMHEETSDGDAAIHRGTKVRKMHASRRDAFRSMNAKPLGKVHGDGRVEFGPGALPRAQGPVTVDDRLDEHVALVTFYPGQRPSELEGILKGLHGAVIAGTGLGHVAHDLIPVIGKAVRDGTSVVVATQTLQGRVNLNVYDTGRDLQKAGAIGVGDMLPETAYVKLMWVLGHTREPGDVAKAMATNVAGELNPRIGLDEYAT